MNTAVKQLLEHLLFAKAELGFSDTEDRSSTYLADFQILGVMSA